ncbi:AAA family ATPase [bacterium]|nr:AAA family ATPase [bacterium]
MSRITEKDLEKALNRSPAVAILGPRQCGKSTLAKAFLKSRYALGSDQDNTLKKKQILFKYRPI